MWPHPPPFDGYYTNRDFDIGGGIISKEETWGERFLRLDREKEAVNDLEIGNILDDQKMAEDIRRLEGDLKREKRIIALEEQLEALQSEKEKTPASTLSPSVRKMRFD